MEQRKRPGSPIAPPPKRSCLSKNEVKWRDNLKLLEEFVKAKGRLPAYKECYNGHKLGAWCVMQRHQFRKGLAPARCVELGDVPGWWWDRNEQWLEKLEMLHEFVRDSTTKNTASSQLAGGATQLEKTES